MLLTVLAVPECPNVDVLLDRLRAVLGDRSVDLEVIVVADAEQARASGMTGSPTLLVDGTDPFAAPGGEPSVSCRLYRAADGTVGGSPSVADLRSVLGAGVAPPPNAAGEMRPDQDPDALPSSGTSTPYR